MNEAPQLDLDSQGHRSTHALVAASLAGGIIAASTPMSADDAVKVFRDVLVALSRAVEADQTDERLSPGGGEIATNSEDLKVNGFERAQVL
jgi:hypothetical protein